MNNNKLHWLHIWKRNDCFTIYSSRFIGSEYFEAKYSNVSFSRTMRIIHLASKHGYNQVDTKRDCASFGMHLYLG